jgi:twinkle protein
MQDLTADVLAPYLRIEDERSIKPANEFTKEVLDHYLVGDHITGVTLPWGNLQNKFRLRNGECTIVGGINSSGKSLVCGQILLNAMEQGVKCLSVSLEMSPKSQLARMWRQASTMVQPTLDFGLGFNAWARNKLYFFDKQGSVDVDTLMAVIRYSLDQYNTELILVDSLMTISGIANDDYTAQKNVVCRLADACRELDCHVVLVCHARKSMSVRDKIDRFSIRGAGELTDRVDNVLLLGRYYNEEPDEPDAYLAISKARHWDMAECEFDLWLHLESLNLLTRDQEVRKINLDDEELDS